MDSLAKTPNKTLLPLYFRDYFGSHQRIMPPHSQVVVNDSMKNRSQNVQLTLLISQFLGLNLLKSTSDLSPAMDSPPKLAEGLGHSIFHR